MIEAQMYGMMPSAKIVALGESAPPDEQVVQPEQRPALAREELAPAPARSRPASGCARPAGRPRTSRA